MVVIEEWLARANETTVTNIRNILKDENATTYLMVWSVFEQRIFQGYMRKAKIKNVSEQQASIYDLLNIDDMAKDFYLRYQDKVRFKHLKHNDDATELEIILSKAFIKLSNAEKMYMLLYICYRYRNNIFHGNKGVLSWNKYQKQIGDCISFMIALVDMVKK